MKIAIYILSIGLTALQIIGVRYWLTEITRLSGDELFAAAMFWTFVLAFCALIIAIASIVYGIRKKTWSLVPALLINLVTIYWIIPRLMYGM